MDSFGQPHYRSIHMATITAQIRAAVYAAKAKFVNISPEEARQKASPGDWSKNEILGHLIDSAANNHQRIVRGAQTAGLIFPLFDQNAWVALQRYNEMNWNELIDLFILNNLHFCRVIDGLPEQVLDNLCTIGQGQPVTLRFIITDYLRHLNLHIAQIMEPAEK